MNNAGWLVKGPYSPIEVMQSLAKNSADHTPGYFILLSWWGQFVGNEVAMGRVLSILISLLALAMACRLGRDFVAPVAGLFSIIVLASNAFYNFYIPHVRMYPLLMLASALVLWLYLRITHQQKDSILRDYIALSVACYALANTHAFSALFFSMLGIYHLVFGPKSRRWLWTSVAISPGLLAFSPWIIVLISSMEGTSKIWSGSVAGGLVAVETFLAANTNGAIPLLLFSAAGISYCYKKKILTPKPYLFLFVVFTILLGILAQFTDFVSYHGMRYFLPGTVVLVLFNAAGIYALYKVHKLLGLLLLLWVLSGLAFQETADWNYYVAGRIQNLGQAPWQTISKYALESSPRPVIIGHNLGTGTFLLKGAHSNVGYSQADYYFGLLGLVTDWRNQPEFSADYAREFAITHPSISVVFQTSKVDSFHAADIEVEMNSLGYVLCGEIDTGVDTVILAFRWETLECQDPQVATMLTTDPLEYEYYGASVDAEDNSVIFIDQWHSKLDDGHENLNVSHQLIDQDWDNVAQLDLPLVHEDSLRRFSIDISGVPAGSYRLVAILYDRSTGERHNWTDQDGNVTEYPVISEIVLP